MQHCSLAAPSICTQKHIRQYFINGTLPEPGTVCSVIGPPFPTDDLNKAEGDAQVVLGFSEEDRNLWEAVRALALTVDFGSPLGL